MNKLDLEIAPVFSGPWLRKTPINKIPRILSLKKYKLAFRITALNADYDDKIRLGPTTIRSSDGDFVRYLPEKAVVNGLKKDVQIETSRIAIVFPYQGLFWIDVEVHAEVPTDITTFQITLEGDRGRGEPLDSDTGTLKRNVCRNGVAVLDLFTSQLKKVTLILAVLAAIPILIPILKWIINLFF